MNNNNNQPSYVLKTVENIRVPKSEKNNSIKGVIIGILVILILGSFIFRDNLFGELSWTTKIILISLVFGTLFLNNYIFKPFPIEIHFYNDHLEIHRQEVYYNKNLIRKEIYSFKYEDIKSCTYIDNYKRMEIRGNVHVDLYNYSKDKSVSNNPTISKTDIGICYFYTSAAPNVDFVKEIEEHSPVKVARI